MQRTWMGAVAIAVGILLCGSSAFAAQNVGNTSQKGSLLIFPNIDVSPGWDTIIRISNDANTGVDLTCYYINERKGRRDFHIKLTRKQPIWFSVKNHSGTYPVAQFPTDGTFTAFGADPTKGALLCWATNTALSSQISHNHLSGNATVVLGADGEENGGLQVAYTYPSWNFTARNVAAGAPVGTPGRLDLTGVDGAYDACPSYLVGHFSPVGAEVSTGSGAGTEIVGTSALSVLSCNQDLRQDFILHLTKLKLEVWNEQEVKLTGAYECADSTKWLLLAPGPVDVGGENFTAEVVQSTAAQLKVKGVASTQCPIIAGRATENSALVGTLSTVLRSEATGDRALVGTTLNGAGAQAGFILWDAQDAVVPELR
jgi:hypothetical protein